MTILAFTGEWDSFNLPEVSQRVDAVLRAGARHVVFNVKDLKFVTSAPLGYMIQVHQRLKADAGGLVLSEPSPFLRSTIRTLGLHRFFQVCDSDRDAVAALDAVSAS